ncbi:MAG: T9SS type A sorting domain-containing protein [Muribaculaceae bacterium]|nr:T9SS type A sorting domain-containing protein [Muribaculaceae bacterium]
MKFSTRLLSISAILTAISSSLLAQSNIDHTPRDGDCLHPGIAGSHSLILSVNDTAKTVMVDPQAVSFDDSQDTYYYIDGDTISYVQFATKHRFILRGDTLSYIGYENRAVDFRLDYPAVAAVFPISDGMFTTDEWTGHLFQYGTMMLKHVRGISRGEAQGGWTITDGTDTLRNAVRLRWSLDMAYADPDSVNAAMPDSVASGIISDMQVDVRSMLAERLLTERTMWFTEDARYPVLTDSRVSRIVINEEAVSADTIPLTMLAMHYPASFQRSDTGEDYIAQKPQGKKGSNQFGEYHYEDYDHGTSLKVGEPELSGEAITITLSSSSGTCTATVTLFTDSGMRLTEPKEVTLTTVPQQYTFNVPSGWTGVVLLRVESGNESYTRKTII